MYQFLTIDPATGQVTAVDREASEDAMTDAPFTDTERHLLEWLSKEESSALGECFGTSLWRLVGEQYAIVVPDGLSRGWHYARVSLTEKGWEAVKK